METNNKKQKKVISSVKYIILLLLGLTLTYYLLANANFSIEQFITRSASISIEYILLILVITALIVFINATRWKLLLTSIIDTSKIYHGFFFYYTSISILATCFINQTFGNISIKTLSLKLSQNVKVSQGSMTSIIEHILSLIVLFLLTAPSALYILKLISLNTGIIITIILLSLSFISIYIYHEIFIVLINKAIFLINKSVKILPFLKRAKLSTIPFIDKTNTYSKEYISKLFFFSVLLYFFHIVRYYIYAKALNIDILLTPLILTFPIVYISGIIGITPGSLGISELGWFGALTLMNISADHAATYIIGQRVLNALSILIICGVSYIYSFYSKRRFNTLNNNKCINGASQ